ASARSRRRRENGRAARYHGNERNQFVARQGIPIVAKAWGGRFAGKTDPRVEKFTESISFDARLAAGDIRGSQAHVRMLAHVGLISAAECDSICTTLDAIGGEIARGEFRFDAALEDIHMHIESALIERIGDVGRKLHTARSRNDQVATDLKLYARD